MVLTLADVRALGWPALASEDLGCGRFVYTIGDARAPCFEEPIRLARQRQQQLREQYAAEIARERRTARRAQRRKAAQKRRQEQERAEEALLREAIEAADRERKEREQGRGTEVICADGRGGKLAAGVMPRFTFQWWSWVKNESASPWNHFQGKLYFKYPQPDGTWAILVTAKISREEARVVIETFTRLNPDFMRWACDPDLNQFACPDFARPKNFDFVKYL